MLNSPAHSLLNVTVERLCESIGTAYSLKCCLLWKDANFRALILEEPALNESSPRDFSLNHGLFCFFKKMDLVTGIDREAAALLAARESEERCSETNRRFDLRRFSLRDEQLLSDVARKIIEILGGPRVPRNILSECGWGPGATATLARRLSQVDNKLLEQELSVTSGAEQLFKAELARDNLWLSARGLTIDGPICLLGETKTVNHNRMALVPKDGKTFRSICAEPTGNLFLQKSVGTYIRKRLRLFGIDLDDQSRNQNLARLASARRLATIDLKSASDSMSINLVRDVLPFEWFALLDGLRSHYTKWPDGSVLLNEKFSSMGNGFTFELESLIFFAVVSVIDSGAYASVYGDDIVCSSSNADEVVRFLAVIGFETNKSKSFLSGLFYESCGKHFLSGTDITPAYQKVVPNDDDVPELIRLHNRLYRWFERLGVPGRTRTLRAIRRRVNLFQPDYIEGDAACLIDKFVPSYNRYGWIRLKGYFPSIPDRESKEEALYAYMMRFGGSARLSFTETRGRILRPDLLRYRKRDFSVPPPSYYISSVTKERILTLLRCGS